MCCGHVNDFFSLTQQEGTGGGRDTVWQEVLQKQGKEIVVEMAVEYLRMEEEYIYINRFSNWMILDNTTLTFKFLHLPVQGS